MMIAYVLNMPKGDNYYYEKIKSTIEFLEQGLPMHPGAFAAYFKILNLMPATVKRTIPEGMQEFISVNWTEIEKYYEEPLPEKFRPSKIIAAPVKKLVDAAGQEIITSPSNFTEGQRFEGTFEDACANPPKLQRV